MPSFIGYAIKRLSNAQNLMIWVSGSTLAAYMGPFGTFVQFDLTTRLFLWFGILALGLLLIAIEMSFVDAFFPSLGFREREIRRLIIMPAIITAILYPGLDWLVFVDTPMPIAFLHAFLACYALSAVVTFARLAVASGEETELKTERQPRLLKRLPDGVTGRVLRLSGKNHMVEITTECGRYEVRMRLSDAITEMDGVEGFLTHRSHWIARTAISEIIREKGRHYVVSQDETRIPLSRTHLPVLEAAGLT